MTDNQLKYSHLFWLFPPSIIYIIFEYVRGQLGTGQMGVFSLEPFKGLEREEINRRIFFITATSCFIVFSILSVGFIIWDMIKNLKFKKLHILLVPFVVLAGLVTYNMINTSGHFAFSYEIFGVDKAIIDGQSVVKRNFFFEALNLSDSRLSELFLRIFNVVVITLVLAVFGVVCGAISCLGMGDEGSEKDVKVALARLETYLLLSAVLMVLGLVYYMSYMYWASFITTPNAADFKSYNQIVKNMTIFTGITYSLMIASYYLPIRYILISRLRALEGEKEETGKDKGEAPATIIQKAVDFFSVSADQRQVYSYVFKIASPVVVAWVSQYLNLGGTLG